MGMNGKILLAALAMVLAAAHASNRCEAILPGTFTKVWYGDDVPEDWMKRSYDTNSDWMHGSFPLASCPTCVRKMAKKSTTFFEGRRVVATRTSIKLKQNVWNVKLSIRVGNRSWIWINGEKFMDVKNPKQCDRRKGYKWRTVDVPERYLRNGWNLIAIKAMAETESAFLDLRMSVEQKESCDHAALLHCPAVGPDTPTKMLTLGTSGAKPSGYDQISFDDSAWEMVSFPLGENLENCPRTACFTPGGWFSGEERSMIVTRTEFFLNNIPTYKPLLRVMAVDAWVRINGEKLGDVHMSDCKWAAVGKYFEVPQEILREGKNILVITATGVVRDSSLLQPELVIRDYKCPSVTPSPPVEDIYCPSACEDLASKGYCSQSHIAANCASTCS